MADKVFKVGNKRAASAFGTEEHLIIEVAGRDIEFQPPTDGQLGNFMASDDGGREGLKAMWRFFTAICVKSDDVGYLRGLMDDPKGERSMLIGIINWLIEEWAGRPTKPSSGSTGTRKPTGKRSTVKQPAKG